ncbi:MAG: hypothetical protein MK212_12525 [Saprospiraceae bacterium]|nr:hypothetical protein [Saprospiraceae bacterium]
MRKGYLNAEEAQQVISILEQGKKHTFGDAQGYVEYVSIENHKVRLEIRSMENLAIPPAISYLSKEQYAKKIEGKRRSKFLELLEDAQQLVRDTQY